MKLINDLIMGAIGAIFTYACLIGIYEATNWAARHYPSFAYIKPIVTALILLQFAAWTIQNGSHLLRRDDKRFDPESLRGSAIYCAASLYLFLLPTQKLQSLLIGSDTVSLWHWNSVAYEVLRLPFSSVILPFVPFMLVANGALAIFSSYILVTRNSGWSMPGIWQEIDITDPDFDPEGKATHDIRQHISSLRSEIKALHKKIEDIEASGQSVSFKYEALINAEAALRQDHFRALTEIERLGQMRKTQDADLKDTRDNLAIANQECARLRDEMGRLKRFHETMNQARAQNPVRPQGKAGNLNSVERGNALKQTSGDKIGQSAAADPNDAIQTLMALDPANTPKTNP